MENKFCLLVIASLSFTLGMMAILLKTEMKHSDIEPCNGVYQDKTVQKCYIELD